MKKLEIVKIYDASNAHELESRIGGTFIGGCDLFELYDSVSKGLDIFTLQEILSHDDEYFGEAFAGICGGDEDDYVAYRLIAEFREVEEE